MKKLVLSIEHDEDVMSPRECENMGTMVCWHQRYNLGDTHNHSEPLEFLETMCIDNNACNEELIGDMSMNELMEALQKRVVILPLFLYDHSMLSMSTTSFVGRAQHAEWDSGQVGWIYVTEEVAKRFCIIEDWNSEETRDTMKNYLIDEVETYDTYLCGDVFGFVLEEHTSCGECYWCENGKENECYRPVIENIDSCWGFFGTNWKENGLAEQLGSDYEDMLEDIDGAGKVERILSDEE